MARSCSAVSSISPSFFARDDSIPLRFFCSPLFMKQHEKSIPAQGRTRIPQALDALVEFYTATNKHDEVKKWQAERAKYPEGKAADKK